MIDKKKIIAIVTFIALSFVTIAMAGGRENLLFYVIFIDGYDTSVINEQKIENGKNATVPEDPYHKDYVFVGWYLYGEENTLVTDFTNITGDLKVEARYKTDLNNNGIADDEDVFYTVRFIDGVTNEQLKSQTVLAGMDAISPTPNYHEGYIFEGWDNSYININNNIIVTSVYTNTVQTLAETGDEEKLYCTLNFYDRDANIFETQIIAKGLASSSVNNVPLYEGYTLVGWFEGQNGTGEQYLEGSTVNNSKELYGFWNKSKYNVTINTNGGTLSNGELKNVLEYQTEFILPGVTRNYVITFNPDGGKLNIDSETILVIAPLLGYCKDTTTCTTEELIKPGTKVLIEGHTTYNAVWGEVDEIDLPSVTKESNVSTNFDFLGWSDSDKGTVKHSVPGTIKIGDHLDLFAIYKETVREYTFDIILNKGSFVDTTFINNESIQYGTNKILPNLSRKYVITYNIGDDETLNGEPIQYADAKLLGYCKNKETCTESEIIPAGTQITIDGKSSYYAVWGETTEKVTLLGAAKANSISSKYTLVGWALTTEGDVEYRIPSSINIKEDLNLYSKYTESLREYDVNINFNGGTIDGEVNYLDLQYGSEYTLPSAIKKHKLSLDTNGGTLVSGTDELEGDAKLLGYKLNDGSEIIPVGTKIKVNPNDTYNAVWGETKEEIVLPLVTKTDDEAGSYEFIGWSKVLNGAVTNTTSIKITEDTTLYAKYNLTLKQHKLIFDANGGSFLPGTDTTPVYDYSTQAVLPVPTRNYTLTYNTNGGTLVNSENTVTVSASFMGWCEEKRSCENPIKDKLVVTKTATYYAVWGDAVTPIKLANVIKESSKTETYTFTVWRGNATLPFKAENKMVLNTDTTLNAYYKTGVRKYAVNFVSAFGIIPETQLIKYENTVTDPGNLVSEGKEFYGWYTSMDATAKWNFETDIITTDTTLYGIWDTASYSVSYNTNGGVLESDNSGIYEESTEIILPNVSKNYKVNYVVNGGLLEELEVYPPVSFKGWCKNKTSCLESELIAGETKQSIEENIIYYAIWEAESNAITLPVPTKQSTTTTNYTFTNWTDGTNTYEGLTSIKVAKDTVFTANYLDTERKYTVNFESDYGVIPNSQLVSYEQAVNDPGNLEAEEKTFVGWYKDEQQTILWDFANDKITSDTIIYAKWQASLGG